LARRTASQRTCPKGHTYIKSTDCPTCPACEKEKAKAGFFIAGLAAPARRALLGMGVDSLKKLSRYREEEVLAQHGMGPASLPIMRKALLNAGLAFKP
jgi:hypothetical protein